MPDPRETELAANLARTRARITGACEVAGRDPDSVTLIVVTKFFEAEDVRRLAGLGVRDIGENRDQEASAKHTECADLDLTWHFIGQLQTNKAKSVVRYADLIQTVDRASLVSALGKAAGGIDKCQDVLIQVNLDPATGSGRGGAAPPEVLGLVDLIGQQPSLNLRGLMGVAPLDADPRPAFETLAGIGADVRQIVPSADIISAGMSGDLEAAIECGATHLRIGAAVMGSRPTVR